MQILELMIDGHLNARLVRCKVQITIYTLGNFSLLIDHPALLGMMTISTDIPCSKLGIHEIIPSTRPILTDISKGRKI